MVQQNAGTPVFGRRQQPPGSTPATPPVSAPPREEHPAVPAATAAKLPLASLLKGQTLAPGDELLSEAIIDLMRGPYADAKGVHAESVLSALGAIAGFAAQQAVWSIYVRSGKMGMTNAFRVFETDEGERFFFGDLLRMVVSSTTTGQLSVWQVVRNGAMKAGADSLPPIENMFAQALATVGTPDFGTPCWTKGHAPLEPARQALNRFWPKVKELLVTAGCEEGFWPLEVAKAAQRLIVQLEGVMNPVHAALIVMDAAIPMSSIDPLTVPQGT